MATISFKSVGKTATQRVDQEITESPVFIGFKTPLEMGPPGQIFRMHTDLSAQVHDNLRNLIVTNWGERLGRYDFGANLRPLLADWATQDDFDSQAVSRILAAVNRWMPYVSLDSFDNTVVSNGSVQYVRMVITYNVPTLDAIKRQLEVILRMM